MAKAVNAVSEGIFLIREYGTIEITLRELMDARGITRNRLAHLIDARYEVVDKWYKGTVERIDADILARLCFVLDCTPADLIRYNRREPAEPEKK